MMRIDEAHLRAYLDGELAQPDREAVEKLLAVSVEARQTLARLRERMGWVGRKLEMLAPPAGSFNRTAAVLAELSGSINRAAGPGQSRSHPPATWESPSLASEIKTALNQVCHRQTMKGKPFMSRTLLWITSVGFILAAIVVAAGLQPGLGHWLAGVEPDSRPLEQAAGLSTPVVLTNTVIIAMQPISRGTEITYAALGRREEVAAGELPPGRIGGETEAVGKIAKTDIEPGQVIVRGMLMDAAEGMNFELKLVRPLTPCENKGGHTLFIKVEDWSGQGLNNIPVKVQWRTGPDEFAILRTQTVANEPGRVEFPMEDEVYTVRIAAGTSGAAVGLTAFQAPEEPCAGGGPGNGPDQLSYEVIFRQRGPAGSPVTLPPATDPSFGYGIQADPRGDTAANIDHLHTLGFGWVTLRMPWQEVEPIRGAYSWEPWDEVIDAYAAGQVRILLKIAHAPDWARPADDDKSVEGWPADPATYANFVAQVAGRYQGQVQAIEIWNEQNVWYKNGGMGRMDAAAYVGLLRQAYQAIKATDPEMVVVSGGLLPADNASSDPAGASPDLAIDDIEYLRQMYASGAKGYFDALGARPAGNNCPALADWRTVTPAEAGADPSRPIFQQRHHSWCLLGTVEGYRQVMVDEDDAGRPIWVTEFGWAVAANPDPGFEFAGDNTPEEQARWIVDAYRWGGQQPWLGPMFLWNLDYGLTAPGTPMGYAGILNTPAYQALIEWYRAGRP